MIDIEQFDFLFAEAQQKGQAASGGGSRSFDAMKEKMGSMVKTPMTREEACQILNIENAEPATEPVDHKAIMDVSSSTRATHQPFLSNTNWKLTLV